MRLKIFNGESNEILVRPGGPISGFFYCAYVSTAYVTLQLFIGSWMENRYCVNNNPQICQVFSISLYATRLQWTPVFFYVLYLGDNKLIRDIFWYSFVAFLLIFEAVLFKFPKSR